MTQTMDTYWMPFTANRQFKKSPRLLAKAKGMYFWTPEGREMVRVRRLVRGERQTHSMEGDGPALGDRVQPSQPGAALNHVVLGVDLEPDSVIGRGQGLGIMQRLQADTGVRARVHLDGFLIALRIRPWASATPCPWASWW